MDCRTLPNLLSPEILGGVGKEIISNLHLSPLIVLSLIRLGAIAKADPLF